MMQRHDYRYKSDQRDKIFNLLKMYFVQKTKENLPIYGIRGKDLREFTTTRKDMQRGVSRIPLKMARLYEEDLLDVYENDGNRASLS